MEHIVIDERAGRQIVDDDKPNLLCAQFIHHASELNDVFHFQWVVGNDEAPGIVHRMEHSERMGFLVGQPYIIRNQERGHPECHVHAVQSIKISLQTQCTQLGDHIIPAGIGQGLAFAVLIVQTACFIQEDFFVRISFIRQPAENHTQHQSQSQQQRKTFFHGILPPYFDSPSVTS